MSSNTLFVLGLYATEAELERVCSGLDKLRAGDARAVAGLSKPKGWLDLSRWPIAFRRNGLILETVVSTSSSQEPWRLVPWLQQRTKLFFAELDETQVGETRAWTAVDGKPASRQVLTTRALKLAPTFALLLAWCGRNPKAMREAIAKGANVDARLGGQSLLNAALLQHYIPRFPDIHELLAAGADPNATGCVHGPPLSNAIGNAKALRALLKAGAAINALHADETALHQAASIESATATALLLKAGESPVEVSGKIVFETRFGALNQVELIVPFGLAEPDDAAVGGDSLREGIGDVAPGVKRVLVPMIASMIVCLLAHHHRLRAAPPPKPGAKRTKPPIRPQAIARTFAGQASNLAQALDLRGKDAADFWDDFAGLLNTRIDPNWRNRPPGKASETTFSNRSRECTVTANRSRMDLYPTAT